MDLTPPTAVPCTCGQLHRGKNSDGTLCGTFTPKPFPDMRFFAWDACPRHGGFEVGAGGIHLQLKIGERFYIDRRDHFFSERTWMWAKNGYRHGTEPPWEPEYYTPPGYPVLANEDGFTARYPTPYTHEVKLPEPKPDQKFYLGAKKPKKDFTPKFSTPEPGEPISPL